MFERLPGIEMKREQYSQGRAFCDAVADLSDEATLARMWGLAGGHAVAPRAGGALPVTHIIGQPSPR